MRHLSFTHTRLGKLAVLMTTGFWRACSIKYCLFVLFFNCLANYTSGRLHILVGDQYLHLSRPLTTRNVLEFS